MSGAIAVAIALSLVSAVAYASAAVAQERLAARTAPKSGLISLLGHGAWWWAVGLNATGALLHVAALTYGSLTVVQPLGALTLVAAVPLGARRAGRQVSRGEWRGTAFTLIGLAVILLTAAGAAPSETLTLPQALGVAGAAMALVALLTRPGARPGLRHAASSGITSGVASALTQTVTVAATARGTGALPLWQVAAVALLVAGFASGGLLLSQRAYQGGGLGAPLAVLTLANPVAASAIGLALLGERLHGGALGVAAAIVGAVVAARGVVLLTRTTATQAQPQPQPQTKPQTQVVAQPQASGLPLEAAVRTVPPQRPDAVTPDAVTPDAVTPDAVTPDSVTAGAGAPDTPIPAVSTQGALLSAVPEAAAPARGVTRLAVSAGAIWDVPVSAPELALAGDSPARTPGPRQRRRRRRAAA